MCAGFEPTNYKNQKAITVATKLFVSGTEFMAPASVNTATLFHLTISVCSTNMLLGLYQNYQT